MTVRDPEFDNTIQELANAMQVVALLSKSLRNQFGEAIQHAVQLDEATNNAVRILKRLQPENGGAR